MNLREPADGALPPIGSKHASPDILTRAALLLAAALPWYAVFSGVYGLYFYILLATGVPHKVLANTAAEIASMALFNITLFAAIPLALLLLLVLPAGAVWAAFRRPLQGLPGQVVKAGCLASMAFCAIYSAIIVGIEAYSITQGDAGGILDPWPALHGVILLAGLVITAKAWHGLKDGRRTSSCSR